MYVSTQLTTRQFSYQIPQEVPLFGTHVIQSDTPIHETADSMAGWEREGLVLGKSRRRHSLASGGGVVILGRGI